MQSTFSLKLRRAYFGINVCSFVRYYARFGSLLSGNNKFTRWAKIIPTQGYQWEFDPETSAQGWPLSTTQASSPARLGDYRNLQRRTPRIFQPSHVTSAVCDASGVGEASRKFLSPANYCIPPRVALPKAHSRPQHLRTRRTRANECSNYPPRSMTSRIQPRGDPENLESMFLIGSIVKTTRSLGKRMECKSDHYEHETSERAASAPGRSDCANSV